MDLLKGIVGVLVIGGATFVYMSWDSGMPIDISLALLPFVLTIFLIMGGAFAVLVVLMLAVSGVGMTNSQRNLNASDYMHEHRNDINAEHAARMQQNITTIKQTEANRR